jgi:hypothetical protein
MQRQRIDAPLEAMRKLGEGVHVACLSVSDEFDFAESQRGANLA